MSDPRSDDRMAGLGCVEPPTDSQYLAAAQVIRDNAHNPDDAALLLDAILGPLSTPKQYAGEHGPAHYSRGCRHPECIAANSTYRRERMDGRIPKYTGGAK